VRRSLSAGPSGGVRLVPDVLAAAVAVLVFWAPPTLGTASPARLAAGWALAAVTGLAMVSRRRFPGPATVATRRAERSSYGSVTVARAPPDASTTASASPG
jgi:hypothetical protein